MRGERRKEQTRRVAERQRVDLASSPAEAVQTASPSEETARYAWGRTW
jgi:hypothetical protein